ncbi:MAG: glycoside hydrolase, partial [Verrucomicrobia bacterium]|nr:glycoside hydrolase [Verrucomicrobiota bacterium]
MKILGILLAAAGTAAAAETTLDLSGEWRFSLDRGDTGIAESWPDRTLDGKVRLPGSLTGQRIGDPVTADTKWTGGIVDRSYFTDEVYAPYRKAGNVKIPFWLQPETVYAGPAWYQRDIEIPADWKGRRAVLSLERPHWETRVWIDGRCVGTNNALGTPHDHDLGLLAPGRHTLTLRVDNRMVVDVGENSHSVSDHTQGNWNGVVGRIELRSTPPVWIEDVQVFPDAARKAVRVRVTAKAAGAEGVAGVRCQVSVRRRGGKGQLCEAVLPLNWSGAIGAAEGELALGPDAVLWDEFSPALHEMTATLAPSSSPSRHLTPDTRHLAFGLRDFNVRGTQFAINGRPV